MERRGSSSNGEAKRNYRYGVRNVCDSRRRESLLGASDGHGLPRQEYDARATREGLKEGGEGNRSITVDLLMADAVHNERSKENALAMVGPKGVSNKQEAEGK